MAASPAVSEADPFELPEWLGTAEVTWTARSSVRGEHLVSGWLSGGEGSLDCDLLAADQAFPRPVLDEQWRPRAHQQWTHGQVLLVEYDGRLTLAVPGTEFTADRLLEALARLAKAVGVPPARFVAALRL
ncbi:MAG TPA: hypothetical protein VFG63_02885 [Nocardioidaceae bacterium]|nr:hypothetical protein [Nocardioidaceae bacterium]